MSVFEQVWHSVVKMPVGDKMYRATRDTRNYDWDAYGDTPEHAREALANKWRDWMKTSGASMPLDEFMEDVSIIEMISGQATMDGEPYSSDTYDKDYLHPGPNDPSDDAMRRILYNMDMKELDRILSDPTKDNDYRYLSREAMLMVGDDEIRDIFSQLPPEMQSGGARGVPEKFSDLTPTTPRREARTEPTHSPFKPSQGLIDRARSGTHTMPGSSKYRRDED